MLFAAVGIPHPARCHPRKGRPYPPARAGSQRVPCQVYSSWTLNAKYTSVLKCITYVDSVAKFAMNSVSQCLMSLPSAKEKMTSSRRSCSSGGVYFHAMMTERLLNGGGYYRVVLLNKTHCALHPKPQKQTQTTSSFSPFLIITVVRSNTFWKVVNYFCMIFA